MEAALRILGLQPGDISDTDTLVSLGMDSMQMVEVRQLPSKTLVRPQIIPIRVAVMLCQIQAVKCSIGHLIQTVSHGSE